MRQRLGHMSDFDVRLRWIYLYDCPRHHQSGMVWVNVSVNEPLAERSLIDDVHIQPVACSHMALEHKCARGGRNGVLAGMGTAFGVHASTPPPILDHAKERFRLRK
jgi:hypothetical protein